VPQQRAAAVKRRPFVTLHLYTRTALDTLPYQDPSTSPVKAASRCLSTAPDPDDTSCLIPVTFQDYETKTRSLIHAVLILTEKPSYICTAQTTFARGTVLIEERGLGLQTEWVLGSLAELSSSRLWQPALSCTSRATTANSYHPATAPHLSVRIPNHTSRITATTPRKQSYN